MASPIQFIREQIADAAIDNAKLDLASAGLTYNFGSVGLEAATASAGDDSKKVATTEYVQGELTASALSGGAAIGIVNNKVFVEVIGGSTGLTYSDGTDNALLKIDYADGLEFNLDGKLVAKVSNDAIVLDSQAIALRLNSAALSKDANGLAVVVDDSTLEVDALRGLQVKDKGIGYDQLAFIPTYAEYTASGSQAEFVLNDPIVQGFETATIVFKNGQRMSQVQSNPQADEYTAAGSTITFGSNVTSGAVIQVNTWIAS